MYLTLMKPFVNGMPCHDAVVQLQQVVQWANGQLGQATLIKLVPASNHCWVVKYRIKFFCCVFFFP
jgi:hypothetical protein